MFLTKEDLIRQNLEFTSSLNDGAILDDLISDDELSQFKADMADGVNYYGSANDITGEDFTEYIDRNGNTQWQDNKANNKLVHGFFPRMVDEKIGFMLGSPVAITHDDDKLVELLNETLGDKFDDILIDWCYGASIKGVEWMHPFINSKGGFDYVIIPAQEIIAVYDTSLQKDLVMIIRYYIVTENVAGVDEDIKYVEVWDKQEVKFYKEDSQSYYKLYDEGPHFTEFNSVRPDNKVPASWGRVPFVPLKNNTNMYTDLRRVKSLIDAYDKNESIGINNLEDIQEAIITATGVGEDPGELRDNLRKFKVISSADESAKINNMTVEIPHEARDRTSKNLEENIYSFGMGINPKNDTFGNSPTGVALKWLYMPLDLKASMLERKMILAINEFFWFLCEYWKRLKKADAKPEEFKITFNKNMIANETEQIDNVIKSKGTISDETALSNHPWVDDPQEEAEAVQKQNENEINSFRLNLQDSNAEPDGNE